MKIKHNLRESQDAPILCAKVTPCLGVLSALDSKFIFRVIYQVRLAYYLFSMLSHSFTYITMVIIGAYPE